MDKFPLFIDLRGRRALVFGGGAVALRRAAVLVQYGAAVTVVASEPLPELERLPVTLERRPYRPGEIEKAFLVVAATDDLPLNAQITREARLNGAWANNASDHNDCDFFFPAVVRRENLSIGITGTGENHRQVRDAAEKIRRIEL